MATLGVLEVLIRAKDDTGSGIKTAESNVKSMGNKLSAWTVAKGQMIARFAERAVMSTANVMKSVSKEALKAYANYEQQEGGIKKLFGDDWMTVAANARAAFKSAGMSANDYMETVTNFSASLVGSLGGDTKEAAKVADMAIRDMSDNVNTFGSSMESVENAYKGFAKQNYTMLDNLKLGYGGTKKEMERLLADAAEFQKQNGKNVQYDINNLADVYNAINVIQKKLNIAGTTEREAKDTISGSWAQAKAAWQNVLTQMATGKSVKWAVTRLTMSLKNVFKNVLPAAKGMIQGFVTSFKSIVSESKINLAKYFGLGDDASWGNIASAALQKLKGKLAKTKIKIAELLHIPEAESASWGTIASNIVTRLGGAMKKGSTLLKALILGDSASEDSTWGDVATELTKKLQDAFKDGGILDILLGDVADKTAAIAQFAGDLIVGISDWIGKNGDQVTKIIENIVNSLIKAAPKIAEALGTVFSSLLDVVFGKGAGAAVIESIKTLLGIKDKPTKEQKESGKSTRDYLDEKSKDEAIAWMDKAFGDTQEAQEAKGQYKKYRDSKEGKPNAGKWMRDDIDALDQLLAKADEASGGVQETAEDAVDAVDTVTEQSTEKASKSVEKAKSGVLDVFNSFKDNYDRNSKFFDEDWAGFLGDALKDAGYEGEQLNNILSQLDFSTLESKGEEVGSYIESILTANPPKADVSLQPDDSAITSALAGGYDATVRLHGVEAADGSNAKGLMSVPYDNYTALLHRGEMVLTASQARKYRDGDTGGSAEVVGAIQSLKNEMANMKIMVGQRVFGRTVVDYSGRRMNNYLGNADSKLAAGYGT